MNALVSVLAAALTFSSPLMDEYRALWNSSDKSDESAEIIVEMIKADFSKLKKTEHKGLADLLGIDHVQGYRVPPTSSLVVHSKPTR